MKIAFDLDDTLCKRPADKETLGVKKYDYCEPILETISLCNQLYYAGHEIIIYTARGMSIFKGDVGEVHKNLYEKTFSDLQKWGVKFNLLVMGKLHYDLLVDDKAVSLEEAKIKIAEILKK